MKHNHYWIEKAFFIIGMALLLVNIYGQFTRLRIPTLQDDINRIHKNDITISEDEIYQAINSEVTDKKEYVITITETIHNGIGDYWGDEGADKFHLRVPFQENFILFISSYLFPQKFLKHEFSDYHRAIERGVGLCSEHSIIMAEVLFEKGIKTHIVGLDGHVVTTALVDEDNNEWWILDGGDGVVVPYDIKTLENNPKLIASFYLEKGIDNHSVANLERIYGQKGNIVAEGYGIGNYTIKTHYFEDLAYILIWVIPGLLFLPYVLVKIKAKNLTNHK